MKTLCIDCSMGAAGDMLTSALLELLPDPQGFLNELNALGIPGVEYRTETVSRGGVTGTHMTVTVHGEEEENHHSHGDSGHSHHHHNTLKSIRQIVAGFPVNTMTKLNVMAVYGLIAEAESHAHGCPVEEVHFHEVGAMDAVADVTAVCLLMERLDPDEVLATYVHVGSGFVKCAHGTLPVPAPATAYLLKGIPSYSAEIKGELCTPTGAALLKHFVDEFREEIPMKAKTIGVGMGTRDFGVPNCLRVMLDDPDREKEQL